MKSDLTHKEQQYLNQIMDILKASGVNPSYREDAKIQLIEHINEARIRNEDFQADLGTPENFALHFMDTAVTKEDSTAQRIDHAEITHQNKKIFSFKGPLAFVFLSSIYYAGLQFLTVLLFTPVLAPDYGFDFHLFNISNYLWWNLLFISINVTVALILSGLTMKLLSKRYRLS
ncbi:hypothetical protein AWW70_26190 [Bacillus mycoides]|uniref:Uncharacterized protein n=1 Tax=Bacillus mycoides TaxID=1405 RepID=A0A109FUU6_BACMY|nr:hypothetical protein [Bacillus mycoides]KWU54905.1 hypothetical protein AWW70_26190 [Bacillus mycoides]